MKDKKIKTEYNYLVLTDFSEASYNALKYTISLAKLIKGNIHVCHIADPSSIVKDDNQVAALRELTIETRKIEKKISAIIEMIQAEGLNAIPYSSIGNIINEFKELNTIIKPEVVIFGKNIEENPKLTGKLTSYLMNQHEGSLFIIGQDSVFHNDTKISVACNENTFDLYEPNLIFSLNNQTKSPLKLLNIKDFNNSSKKITIPKTWGKSSYELDQDIHIEQNSTVLDGLLHCVTNSNTDLLCIGRGKPRNYIQRVFSINTTTVSGLVNKVQTPILVMGTVAD